MTKSIVFLKNIWNAFNSKKGRLHIWRTVYYHLIDFPDRFFSWFLWNTVENRCKKDLYNLNNKLRWNVTSLLNSVPYVLTCQRALRAYVLTCQRALRAYMLTCQRALCAYVLTCQRALRAYVLRCQHAYVLMCQRASIFLSHLPAFLDWLVSSFDATFFQFLCHYYWSCAHWW